MILKLKQFLEQTDVGKEEWTIGSLWKHNTKCRNGKIKIPFWRNHTELYDCYVRDIVLPCHEIYLCTNSVNLNITECETTDKEKTINLLQQIGDINGNNLIPIELCTLRNIARWDDIIDISNEYEHGQYSVLNEKYNFMVKSWYIIDNILFVRREEIDVKDATLKNVIKSYSKDQQIYYGVVVKQGDWSALVPWTRLERIKHLYKKKVIGVRLQAYRGMVEITIEDDKENNDMDKKRELKTYFKNEKLDKQIILIDAKDVISCNVSDILHYDDYKKYGEYIVNDVDYGDLPVFYIEKPKNDTERKKTIDISINESDVKKIKDALESMKDVVSKIPDTQFMMPVKQGVITNNKKNDLETELHDIIGLMCSEDYKDRFKAEYLQLKMRYNKLHKMIVKYEANKLDFKPSCDIELLKKQKAAMGNYLYCLEVRAQIEGIDLK